MKKNNLAEFFKSKSFYALLCVGALAIIAIAMVGLNQSSESNRNKNLVDLNEPISDVADGEDISNQEIGTVPDTNNTTSSTTANNETGNGKTEVAQGNQDQSDSDQAVTDGSLLEFDAEDSTDKTADANSTTEAANTAEDDKEVAVKPTTEPVKAASSTVKQQDTKPVMKLENLHFKPDDGLLWPVSGNVIMDYSADRVIYFATLEQFKCNPAIIIDAEVGTEVQSAAQGIVTSIKEVDETGLTVTATIGNGYSVVYGQLKDVTVEVGDTIDEGSIIGKIADPSKYYTVEGSNLYFQVIKDEDTMNPMLLLRDSSNE